MNRATTNNIVQQTNKLTNTCICIAQNRQEQRIPKYSLPLPTAADRVCSAVVKALLQRVVVVIFDLNFCFGKVFCNIRSIAFYQR